MSNYFWKPDERKFLIDNYPTKGAKYCAEELNRTLDSINGKAKREGLKVIVGSNDRKRLSHAEYLQKLLDVKSPFVPIESYIDSKTPIVHRCVNGHERQALSGNMLHVIKHCSECRDKVRFDYSKKAFMYFVSFEYEDIQYYKIGITNKSKISDRFVGDWKKYNMKLLWFREFTTGYEAKEAESKIKKTHSQYLIDTGLLRSGNTETMSVYIKELE